MPGVSPDSPDTNDTARQWCFWSIMALLPVLVAFVCLWLLKPNSTVLGFLLVATPLWIGICAVNLAVLHGTRSTAFVVYSLLFLIVDTLLIGALLWGSCMLAR
jgi:hypothetical protein